MLSSWNMFPFVGLSCSRDMFGALKKAHAATSLQHSRPRASVASLSWCTGVGCREWGVGCVVPVPSSLALEPTARNRQRDHSGPTARGGPARTWKFTLALSCLISSNGSFRGLADSCVLLEFRNAYHADIFCALTSFLAFKTC